MGSEMCIRDSSVASGLPAHSCRACSPVTLLPMLSMREPLPHCSATRLISRLHLGGGNDSADSYFPCSVTLQGATYFPSQPDPALPLTYCCDRRSTSHCQTRYRSERCLRRWVKERSREALPALPVMLRSHVRLGTVQRQPLPTRQTSLRLCRPPLPLRTLAQS